MKRILVFKAIKKASNQEAIMRINLFSGSHHLPAPPDFKYRLNKRLVLKLP